MILPIKQSNITMGNKAVSGVKIAVPRGPIITALGNKYG